MTQYEIVITYLNQHGSITALDAVPLGILRLAAVIHDLRAAGMQIETVMHHKNHNGRGVHWAEYKIKEPLPVWNTKERQEGEVATLPSENITNF